jgi:hypothetical protein
LGETPEINKKRGYRIEFHFFKEIYGKDFWDAEGRLRPVKEREYFVFRTPLKIWYAPFDIMEFGVVFYPLVNKRHKDIDTQKERFGAGFGDLSVEVKYNFLKFKEKFEGTWNAAFKFPTGVSSPLDEHLPTSDGSLDFSTAIYTSCNFWKMKAYLNLGYTLKGQESAHRYDLGDVFFVSACLDFPSFFGFTPILECLYEEIGETVDAEGLRIREDLDMDGVMDGDSKRSFIVAPGLVFYHKKKRTLFEISAIFSVSGRNFPVKKGWMVGLSHTFF